MKTWSYVFDLREKIGHACFSKYGGAMPAHLKFPSYATNVCEYVNNVERQKLKEIAFEGEGEKENVE